MVWRLHGLSSAGKVIPRRGTPCRNVTNLCHDLARIGGAVRPGLKTIDDARALRERLLSACELAERSESDEVRQRCLTTVIIGGGATGVEMAGCRRAIAAACECQSYHLWKQLLFELLTDIVSCQAISTLRRFSPDCLLVRMRQNWSFGSGAHIAL